MNFRNDKIIKIFDVEVSKNLILIGGSTVLFILVLFFVSIFILRSVIHEKDEVGLNISEQLLNIERLALSAEKQASNGMAYLQFKRMPMLERMKANRKEFKQLYNLLMSEAASKVGEEHLESIGDIYNEYDRALKDIIEAPGRFTFNEIQTIYEKEVHPKHKRLSDSLIELESFKTDHLNFRRKQSILAENWAFRLALLLGLLAALVIPVLSYLLYKAALRNQEVLNTLKKNQNILASVSHDLKNPLGTIMLGASLMEKKASKEDVEWVRNQAGKIQRSGLNMKALIEDLLSLTKIDSGHLRLNCKPTSATALAIEGLEMLQSLTIEQNIIVEHSIPKKEIYIIADYRQLLRVLSNLIGNAIKFTPKGGRVKLAMEVKEKYIQYQVSDNGPGIPDENLPHIFDRFWQAEETAQKGTGLGLAIAKSIVSEHHGKIWVESQIDQGTTFFFTVPIQENNQTQT